MTYAELQVTSNFTFLRGASHPEELVARAHELGLAGLALTDRNSLAGVVRAHVEAKRLGLRLVVGCRLDLRCGTSLLCWPTDRDAYGRLSSLLTLGKLRAPKGKCDLTLDDVLAHEAGQVFALIPPEEGPPEDAAFASLLGRLAARWGPRGNLHLALSRRYRGDDAERLATLAELARGTGTRPLATNDVLLHAPERRRLQDVLACIREGVTLDRAAPILPAHAERHLKPPAAMARLFADRPGALAATLEVLERCRFSLDDLAYDYPARDRYGLAGRTPDEELARRAWRGARARYGGEPPEKVAGLIRHELGLIRELRYAPYFLTVHDIVRFARTRKILCQGRGSAANSAVCYALRITAVDPERLDVLFERFVSAARGEPPDIDVDFEHERREEVIQWIYATQGRDRAALAATVIRYRAKSALREVAKALGLSADVREALARTVWGYGGEGLREVHLREAGLDPDDPTLGRTLLLAQELLGFPRHLSQHVGGFVITKSPLRRLVPIGNAAMAGRTAVEWDKDDLDAVRLMKIDVLALGMLSCIRRAFELLRAHRGIDFGLDLDRVPAHDPAVYEMIGAADTIGVFQVESRAQMSMLPRLRPKTFHDLVVEVAIVRPGPIQGDMVHPYLRRREGREAVGFPRPDLEEVLGRTLGVPLFQEQAMRLAVVAAGFTHSEADGLRRSMAAFRRSGEVERWRERLVAGMMANGHDLGFAEACIRQIEGFGHYGFPESHSASFALLVYVSAWLKRHHPDVFACAILNSQPMGFYAPAQLVRDAIDHGVEVRGVDVNRSFWDHTLEPREQGPTAALRLGLRQVKGLTAGKAERIVAGRVATPYPTLEELGRRARLQRATLVALAAAGACRSLALERRPALWAAQAVEDPAHALLDHAMAALPAASNLPSLAGSGDASWSELPPMSPGERAIEDHAALRLSLEEHPLALLRGWLHAMGVLTAQALWHVAPGRRATVCGLALIRQRPGSAKGTVFLTLEDETGLANLLVWPRLFARSRRTIMTARLLAATGIVQREGDVLHLFGEALADLTPALHRLRGREGG